MVTKVVLKGVSYLKRSEIDKCGKAAKRLIRSAPNLAHIYADSFRNEHRLKENYPSRPQGAFWGFMWSKIQV